MFMSEHIQTHIHLYEYEWVVDKLSEEKSAKYGKFTNFFCHDTVLNTESRSQYNKNNSLF